MTELLSNTYLATTKSPDLLPTGAITVIVNGPNGGGIRKTNLAKYLGSVAMAAGHKVLFVCGDPGIGGLSFSLEIGRYAVAEFPTAETPDFFDHLASEAQRLGATIVIVDLGANEMMKSVSVRNVRALLESAKKSGCPTYVVLALVPFKVGLFEDADNFANRLRHSATVVPCYNGREAGGDFSELDSLKLTYLNYIEIPSDPLAIVGDICRKQMLPFDYASTPEPNFTNAASMVAFNLLSVALQQNVINMLNSQAAVATLTKLAASKPVYFDNRATQRWEITDDVVNLHNDCAKASEAFWSITPQTPEAEIVAVALQLRESFHAHVVATKSAKERYK